MARIMVNLFGATALAGAVVVAAAGDAGAAPFTPQFNCGGGLVTSCSLTDALQSHAVMTFSGTEIQMWSAGIALPTAVTDLVMVTPFSDIVGPIQTFGFNLMVDPSLVGGSGNPFSGTVQGGGSTYRLDYHLTAFDTRSESDSELIRNELAS